MAPTITVFGPGSPPPAADNRFAALIPSQSIAVVSEFTLESGVVMKNVPVAFRTWGKLNEQKDNAMVLCHALTGSSDVEDWWGPLLGPAKAFDPTRFFIFCANVLGSPYGTASPTTRNPDRPDGGRWGPEFPATVTRDDVRLQKLLLDYLKVASVAVVIGGSMGGMAVLEWPLTTPPGYVRNICPIATSARHSAWGISWGEAQRQSIYSDPEYEGGWYAESGEGPKRGLAAARMAALLTYRSRDSFESRFGRKEVDSDGEGKGKGVKVGLGRGKMTDGWGTPRTAAERAEAAHNDGHRPSAASLSRPTSPSSTVPLLPNGEPLPPPSPPPIFSAQSYLRYQGDKFVSRFDANCYIHLTRKMDAHDIFRGRPADPSPLTLIPAGTLVIAISSDGLFTLSEHRDLVAELRDAELVVIDSPDGHDGFLLEFEQINNHVLRFLHARLPKVFEGEALVDAESDESGFTVQKASLFGEAEGDVTSFRQVSIVAEADHLSSVIRWVGEKYSVIRSKWVTKIFVSFDVTSFVFQAAGGVLLEGTPSTSQIHTGRAVLIIGFVIQVISISVFVVFAYLYQRRARPAPAPKPVPDWVKVLRTLYAGIIIILVRSIFRTLEFGTQSSYTSRGPFVDNEAWPYSLEATPMVLVCYLYALYHPARLMPSDRNERSDGATQLENKGQP
ncbi:homoserine o-acetyltransferase [Pseudohyphozyma bogoriensis]|nr:homoserine o-acetyltransferase [Pseudohyphozyma bogoriensis]